MRKNKKMVITSKVNSKNSTCVAGATYDTDTKTLTVTYPSGVSYDYLNVPEDVFEDFEDAPSAGQFVNAVIKPTYACV